jgi:hypothetical protein
MWSKRRSCISDFVFSVIIPGHDKNLSRGAFRISATSAAYIRISTRAFRLGPVTEVPMNGLRRYGKMVVAAALLAILAGCVVEPVGYYGYGPHPYYYGGYYHDRGYYR